jgi:hypothetical protein
MIKEPFEALGHLKAFGCMAYVYIPKNKWGKLESIVTK